MVIYKYDLGCLTAKSNPENLDWLINLSKEEKLKKIKTKTAKLEVNKNNKVA